MAFFSQLENSFTAIIVDFDCFLQRIIEVHGCCTIDDYVNILDDQLSLFWWDSKMFNCKITRNWNDFTLSKCYELFITIQVSKILEALARYDLLFDSLHRIDLSFWSNHHKNFINIRTSSQKFFKNDFTQKSSASSNKYFTTTPELFNIQYLFVWHDCFSISFTKIILF